MAMNLLRGAGHAVVMTLCSRAHRIGLDGTSCLLHGLFKRVSLDLFLVVVVGVGVLACPALELLILAEQELGRFAHDVGSVCVDELGVLVQVISDSFLQANLMGCSLRLLRWCFQKCQVFLLLSLFAMHYSLHYKLPAPIPARGH